MDTVTCSCLKCHSLIGTFENLWDKIGKTYYSPIHNGPNFNDLGGLVVDGEVRAAAKTGVIENSFLQDLACKGCGEKLGLRCDSAPESHILTKDQLIIRAAGMSIISDDTGKRAALRVRKKFSLTGRQASPPITRDTRERSFPPTADHVEDGHVIPEHDTPVPLNNGDPLPGLIQFAEWAKEAIASQRKDIGRISGIVSKIEKDMRNFRDFMFETRKDLASVPGRMPWEKMKKTVASLEDEVGSMRNELDSRRPGTVPEDGDGVRLTIEELEVLTNSITTISQKVNEVESLKLELQFMKARLKRFEDASRAVKHTTETIALENSSVHRHSAQQSPVPPQKHRVAPGVPPENESDYLQRMGIVPRKRKSSELGGDGASDSRSDPKDATLPAPAPNPRPAPGRKLSRLSSVQLLDEIPDTAPVNTSILTFNSTSDVDPNRAYDSAPESRPARRKPIPIGDCTTMPPALLGGRTSTPGIGSRGRRAYSEGLRNADGVRLTKNGMPDRRSANGRNLKQHHERMRREKGQEMQGWVGGKDEDRPPQLKDGGRSETDEVGREKKDVLPSVESRTSNRLGITPRQDVAEEGEEEDARKQAEMLARERLVQETLERELL